ncbi:hypothetical protein JCM8547_008597 [Rhodosporidiobolus lusitaniae]
MPLAITSYLTETPSLRPVIYYATWGLYWLSYALSPGLVTVLQVLVMVLTGGLPWLERATARWRTRVASHEWASVRFRDEFVDPRAPPAEWPGWLKSTGSALDMRWVGSSVWESVSRFFKGIGGWFGGSGDATAAPAIPVPPAASVFSARPAAKHAATMPAFAPSAAGYSEHYKAPSVARSTSLSLCAFLRWLPSPNGAW